MKTATIARTGPLRRLGAIITQVLSYMTTLSAAAYLMRPTTEIGWALTAGAALAFEIVFIVLKEGVFQNAGDLIGWTGFLIDGLVNAGGILPWAPRLLTFGPVALILGLLRIDVSDPTTALIGGAAISLVLGGALSYAPHRLWRPARSKRTRDE
jgi:hypothetical protein